MALVFKWGKDGTESDRDNARVKGKSLASYQDDNGYYEGVEVNNLRAGLATEVDKDNTYQEAGTDVLRFDYSDNPNGDILTEDTETNVLFNSGWVNNGGLPSNWSQPNTGTATPVNSKYGNKINAYRFVASNERPFLSRSFSVTNGATYTLSVEVEEVNDNLLVRQLLNSLQGINKVFYKNGVQITETTPVDEPAIYSMVYETNASFIAATFGGGCLSNDTSDIVISQPSYILGNKPVRESFIITPVGNSATRASDTGITTGDISHLINSEEGVLEFDIAALAQDQSLRSLSISDETTNNRILFKFDSFNPNGVLFLWQSDTTPAIIETVLVSDITEKSNIKIKWKQNDLGVKINGVEVYTNNSFTVSSADTLSHFKLGKFDSTQPMFARIAFVKIYDSADNY